jgi:hypothetical protein
MLNAYQLQQVAIGKKIRWMSDPYGLAWLAAMGASKDFLVDLAKQAVKCRMPGLSPLDALALLGQERGIFQAPGESSAAFAVRVINAWQAWQLAGGAWGILYQLALRGYTTAYLAYPNGQVWGPSAGVTATVPPTISQGPVWNMSPIDGQAGPVGGPPDPFGRFWNRTLLFFYPVPASWTNIVNPPTSSTAPTAAEISTISQILKRWGAGHSAKIGIAALVGTANGTGRACFGWPVRTFAQQIAASMTLGGVAGQSLSVVFSV